MRILDTKDEGEQAILKSAPRILDCLDNADEDHYDTVKAGLDALGISYEQNDSLVRGLDYYGRTTFEITSDALGAQNALCGGGRYDDLLEELGGKPTPAVGFAAGMERILLAISKESATDSNTTLKVFVISAGKGAGTAALQTAMDLRSKGVTSDFDTLQRSVKAQMREANRQGATHTVVIGEEELANGTCQVKNLSTSEQKSLPFKELFEHLTAV